MKNETARREIESLDYYLQNHTNDYSEESHTAMMMAIKALEQQPKTGHWIEKEDYNLDTYYECSECGEDYCIEGDILFHKYCPNCGSEMTELKPSLKEMEGEDD